MTSAPTSFDGHYYAEVVQQTGKKGWFQSDKILASGLQTVRQASLNPLRYLYLECSQAES